MADEQKHLTEIPEDVDPQEVITVKRVVKKRVLKGGAKAAAPAPAAPVEDGDDVEDEVVPLNCGAPSARQTVRLNLEKAFWNGEITEAAITQFMANYDAAADGATGFVSSGRLVETGDLPAYGTLAGASNEDDLIKKTVIVKLNAEIGYGLGSDKTKSVFPVRDGKSFLDIAAAQAAPLVAKGASFLTLNSFATEADTKAALAGANVGDWDKVNLKHSKVPKVLLNSQKAVEGDEAAAPGTGDLFTALFASGKLAELAHQGKEYLFISNADNLGASFDTKLLNKLATGDASMLMEVCERKGSDKKVNHLARNKKTGKFVLREPAQVDDEDREDFEDVAKYNYFNTNNLWIKIHDLKRLVAEQGGVKLPLCKSESFVNPVDGSTDEVVVLESTVGSIISLFDQEESKDKELEAKHKAKPMKAEAVVVPRGRFTPVYTVNELLAVRSDAYEFADNKITLVAAQAPRVDLTKIFHEMSVFEALVQNGASYPSLKGCKSLMVNGGAELIFHPGCVFVGDVSLLTGDMGAAKELEAGTYEGDHSVA